MQQSRKPIPSALASLAVALAAIVAGLHPACAEDTLSPGGMQIFLTPYLWLAGINATTKTPLAREPEVNSDVSAIDFLSHLSGVPFMGSAEIRDGPFGLLGDVLHVPVSTTIRTRNVLFQGGKAALTTNTGTALFLYRALEDPSQFADIGGGFRAWGFSANLNLNAGLLPRRLGIAVGRLGRSSVRRPLSSRARQRLCSDRLWRCRRLRRRRARRLAGRRHDRLRPQPFDQPSSRLSKPQF